jgi:nitrile hydratase accessory protein
MGGMQGFGPITREEDEPVFHASWEGRVIAIRRAVEATGKLAPTLRPAIESLPPQDYLRLSYYEKWLAAVISAEGHFTWKEWAGVLAEELEAARACGIPDDGTRYYLYWLAALERLVMAKGLADSAELSARKEAWADAYRHTPHGKPVELGVRHSAP